MCKSENDPGGPYRCSGDMKSRLDAATKRLTRTREETNTAAAADIKAKERLRSLTAQLSNPDLTDSQRVTYEKQTAKAVAESERTGKAAASATSKFSTASASWRDARRDYDATPRGLAELQAAEHAATDPAERESLNARAGDALDRIQQDETERSKRWGTERSSHFIPPVTTSRETTPGVSEHLEDSNGRLAHRASAKSHPDGSYTYTFYSDQNPKGTPVNVPPTRDKTAPSLTRLVTTMRDGARTHRESPNFVQYCKANGIDRSDPEQGETAKRDYAQAKNFDRDGAKIFGAKTWDNIVGSH